MVVSIVLVHVDVITIAIATAGVTECLMGYLCAELQSQPQYFVAHPTHLRVQKLLNALSGFFFHTKP